MNYFSFEFYINPRYSSFSRGGEFKAGTIFHMSSSFALSLVAGDSKDDNALMDEIKAIHQGGGNGSIIGQNCFQRKREDSLALLDQMIQIYRSK